MKTLQDYQNLKTELETIKANHKETYLDASWICVRPINMNWREAKKIGCKKDYYWGWIFYSTSTNSNGNELYNKIKEACKDFDMYVNERLI
jgi:hypothetical protein